MAILKQGVEAWNKWREKNPGEEIDLSRADLAEANLNWTNLRLSHCTAIQRDTSTQDPERDK